MHLKTVIQSGDELGLRRLLREDPSLANELIRWGEPETCLTHPLHYISDMLFEGRLAKGAEIPLIDALIEAGADLNFQRDRKDGKKSDTPLIGAASLGAEEAGIRLLDAGARPDLRGLFGEIALHWAAMLGEERLATRLIQSVDKDLLNLKDDKYKSPPLGWAVYGWTHALAGNHGRHSEVVELLIANGAIVEPALLASDGVQNQPSILAALRSGNARP